MVKMDKEYVFKNLSGKTSLFELFEGRRQPSLPFYVRPSVG